jgi:hypothetical protein
LDALTELLGEVTANLIAEYGMKAALYHAPVAHRADGDVVPNVAVLAAKTMVKFQFGRQAKEQAQTMGIFAQGAAIAKFPGEMAGKVQLESVLADAKGRAWLVRSEASVTEKGTGTVALAYLVTEMEPDLIPEGVKLPCVW